ncbi:MAG: plasma-membrane proton-efflux P-type ATPase, partial [Thermoleophilia bacterium]|nr:plasma-membrane proton-efflux P-type ATPase [Thermoleophilia bacterium]
MCCRRWRSCWCRCCRSGPVCGRSHDLTSRAWCANARYDEFGACSGAKDCPSLQLVSYFWGPIPWMIEIALILTAAVGHWPDFGIIFVLLAMNGAVGYWEERQAGNAVAALKRRLQATALGRRDGDWQMLPRSQLVPGDVIRLHIGDVVPADARLVKSVSLQIDQSALTGESLPVSPAAGDELYSGSVVVRGEADALVIGTGANTFFGRTAELVEGADTPSHFQQAVLAIGRILIVLSLMLVSLIVAVSLARGNDTVTTLEFALVVTVASIPVALPAVLSVTMAVGAKNLAAREAIVSRLAVIEELAGVDVLCSDKTGTLTENDLALGTPVLIGGEKENAADPVLDAALASRGSGHDPIDETILRAFGQRGSDSLERYAVTDFVPFDPVIKRSEAGLRDEQGTTFRVTKGAPQVIFDLAVPDGDLRARADREVDALAARGYRALAVARSSPDGGWRLTGILPLHDPPRGDSRETIATARAMGVAVKMVTGDQLAIALEVAREVGIGDRIVDASTFESGAGDARVGDTIERADGFAQVFPEHKYRIIEALQARGHIVAMTGDGVNDAPALKKADAGIAVSGATDAARAAAD